MVQNNTTNIRRIICINLIENNPSFVYTAGLMATKWGDELSLYFIIENKTEIRKFE